MIRNIRTFIVAGMALAVLAVPVLARQAATGTITGLVQAANGQPIAGAPVVAQSGADSGYTGNGTTDQDGRFTIGNAPLGSVTVVVYADQRRAIARGQGVLTTAGQTLTLNLRAQ